MIECSKLTHAVLHRPTVAVNQLADPASALHDRPLMLSRLSDEFDLLTDALVGNGVAVTQLTITDEEASSPAALNLMYLRDLAVVTPFGHIMARMGASVRYLEPPLLERQLMEDGWSVIGRIDDPGTVEGADVLWLRPDTAIVAVGNRTNSAGAHQLQAILSDRSVRCVKTVAPRGALHLLGALQVVGPDLALLRHEIVDPGLLPLLRELRFDAICIAENEIAAERHSMNVVVLSPKRVLLRRGCPVMRDTLMRSGIEIVESGANELIGGGGGFGCAVGILRREGMPMTKTPGF